MDRGKSHNVGQSQESRLGNCLSPHLRLHIWGILPLQGFHLKVRQLIGITINICQMDYNLTLHIRDVDDLISCEGGHGSPDAICFDKWRSMLHRNLLTISYEFPVNLLWGRPQKNSRKWLACNPRLFRFSNFCLFQLLFRHT
jgi:hypothetical protein